MNCRTLYDKLWDSHVVLSEDEGTSLLYIDRHLVHEVTSPQAFEGLRLAGRRPWRTQTILAVPDHNVPTTDRDQPISDPIAREQIETLDRNSAEFELNEIKMNDPRQGIVHVIGPEQGATLPGMTVVCGDSHTSTHGAFATLAHGIGTSEVEHVLATQCLLQKKSLNMRVVFDGPIGLGVTAKDMALALIRCIGTAGGTGYAIEFSGSAVRELSMEGRMTLCNMAIEAGARAGMVAVDDKTIAYLKDKPYAPKGDQWALAVEYWKTLHSDEGAVFDHEVQINMTELEPQVTWGTSPEMTIGISELIPDPEMESDTVKAEGWRRALTYMDLNPKHPIQDVYLDKIFIGSCTNSRIEDLRAAAEIVKGKKLAHNIKMALVVPGSGIVKRQAEEEGLHKVFLEAGFEWREPGCSMCLAMNSDRLEPGERCASTSNRNFEGRQGKGGRTHLVSPAMAAAAAIKGHFVDINKI